MHQQEIMIKTFRLACLSRGFTAALFLATPCSSTGEKKKPLQSDEVELHLQKSSKREWPDHGALSRKVGVGKKILDAWLRLARVPTCKVREVNCIFCVVRCCWTLLAFACLTKPELPPPLQKRIQSMGDSRAQSSLETDVPLKPQRST